MIKPSTSSPISDFTVDSTGKCPFKLSSYQGKKLIIYFYPKDNTSGCTQEGKDFRDNIEKFNALNTIIFGVSRDNLKTHKKFKEKQLFPFELLADTDEKVCRLFDVIKTKTMYGRQFLGIERSTFLLDEKGILIEQWRKVKVKTHVQEVLAKLIAISNFAC